MHADLKGALVQLNWSWRSMEHRGNKMSKKEVKAALEYGISKGYQTTKELTDEEVDAVIHVINNGKLKAGDAVMYNEYKDKVFTVENVLDKGVLYFIKSERISGFVFAHKLTKIGIVK